MGAPPRPREPRRPLEPQAHAMSLPRLAAALLVLPSVAAAQEELGPEPVRGLVSRAEGAFEGYTLLAPLRSTTTYPVSYTHLTLPTIYSV